MHKIGSNMGIFRILATLMACILLLGGCRGTDSPSSLPESPVEDTDTPAPELRGVWVSFLDLQTLLTGTDPATAASALDGVMDTCRQQGLNTVFFHVRSHSDAWYQSALFSPTQEVAGLLKEGFDPLSYAVEAAHKRGLTLHAWINPYRIGTDPTRAVTKPEATFQKDGVWYYDPAHPAVRQAILAGVREVLDGYEVDGIHFDDYFYPEGMAAEAESFEDVPADTDPAVWRQTQVNALVSAVYGLVHSHGERLFGVSPAGSPAACAGVYADVATWLETPGYIDYLCPQIYFGFQHETHAFDRLLNTWTALPRREGVALYIGLAAYKVGLADDPYAGTGRTEWADSHDVLARQVTCLREGGAGGFVLFRYQHLTEDTDALGQERQALAACLNSHSD